MTSETALKTDGGGRQHCRRPPHQQHASRNADGEPDPYEPAAEAIIEACGGDPRQAVIALLGERDYLAGRVEALERSVSWGFVRAGAAR